MAITVAPAVLTQEKQAPAPYTTNGLNDRDAIDDTGESEDGLYVSEERYWEEYYDRGDFSYEWNNGYLEVKPVGDRLQFRVYLWFMDVVKDFLHVNPIAEMIGLELGFRMRLPTKVTIRKPDLAIVLHSNPVSLGDKDRTYRGIFDLCIESISDSSKKEVERDTVTKKKEYAQAGVKEYFILDETGIETAFYRLNAVGVYVPIQPANGIIRSTVLPGFQFRRADLYNRPAPPEMVTDKVYNTFISPYYRAERIRAEQEKVRADYEKARADAEEIRAEQEKAHAEQEKARADGEEARADGEKARAEQEKARAEQEKAHAEQEKARADGEKARAEQEKARAEQEKARAEQEKARAEQEKARADQTTVQLLQVKEQAARYAAILKAAGIAVDDDTTLAS